MGRVVDVGWTRAGAVKIFMVARHARGRGFLKKVVFTRSKVSNVDYKLFAGEREVACRVKRRLQTICSMKSVCVTTINYEDGADVNFD